MSAVIIDGKAVAASIREEVARDCAALRDQGLSAPGLSVVLVGDNEASALYVRNKGRAAERAGIAFQLLQQPSDLTSADVLRLVGDLNDDASVDAILVQLPLPPQVDSRAVIEAVSPAKDADGFHPLNFGRLAEGSPGVVTPCTPQGCMELVRRYDVPIAGRRAVVVGRSTIVGRPLAAMLTNADATVTVCHSRTPDLAGVCREADILVAATGRPGMIDERFVKPGACVIDVGTTPTPDGVRGDVDRVSVEPVAGWLTPVPGGVGPMTIAMLLRNTVALAALRRRAPVSA
ncbi:MAG: bifunctional 5,10-methylenetetrahydrofolate dehydrogenase/5,10-methenyltetrahydrofolate cyclohydrolase [Candidatus Dormibacteraeota bacterium]|nr:bifunctional 5,10-methylenetetrahydrofolate dehydrogenase/5,10-methenyltetrahydrofolate cyclohydrolase [Candidatus Dormibacteraeota bacterium]MBV9525956.1 bifunctional 5,10-methylenetetrahydrofolate dehydrogenase/5,10-methenyltetrahydrofolate cyclohydrolase [Candidatus Dormibacteraeota bacterium]